MVYITGTLTDSNPGPALYALMAPALTTAGFTLVDTVVISTRTHKVWKSAAANNTQGLDWYLDIGYNTAGAANLALQPFEFYDPATDLGYRGPYGNSGTTIDAVTSSRYGATGFALETNWQGSGSGFISVLPVTSFAYWASITANRIILLNSNEPTVVLYTGLYQPDPLYAAKAGAALYPLVQAKLIPVSTIEPNTVNGVSLTRVPPASSMGGWQYHVGVSAQPQETPAIPSGTTVLYPSAAIPVQLKITNPNFIHSGIYGQFLDIACARTSGVVRGDTVTMASTLWTLTSTYSHSLLFKQA